MALFPKVGRRQLSLRIAWWAMTAFLIVGVLLHLFPFYYMIVMSFTSARELVSPQPVFWPRKPTTVAWQLVWSIASKDLTRTMNTEAAALMDHPLYVYFRNSMFITLVNLLLSLPITAMAAYANSKLMRGRARRWTFLFFIGTMMIPGIVTLIPGYLLTINFPFPWPQVPNIPGTDEPFPTITLFNTPWAVIIPGVFNAFNFLNFKGFFDTIPDSIINAARVDGGSEFNIFRRIILPMSVPVIAVCAWFQFTGTWNNYLWPLITIQDTEKQTMTVAIAKMVQEFTRQQGGMDASAAVDNPQLRKMLEAGLSWNGLVVLGLLQSFPIFVAFIICREYLMKGIRIRGFK